MKRGKKRPHASYDDAIEDALEDLSPPSKKKLIKHIPPFTTVKSNLYRASTVNVPTISDKLTLPDKLTQSKYGEKYVIYRPQNLRDTDMFVFSSEHNLEDLRNSKVWLADGTFKIAPKGYLQLYTVHGFVNNECLALAHCLLKDKKRSTYEFAFQQIISQIQATDVNYNGPQRMLIDYEEAARAAIKTIMPNTDISGCLFHYGQALYRKISALGLSTIYETDKINMGKYQGYNGEVYLWFRCVFWTSVAWSK